MFVDNFVEDAAVLFVDWRFLKIMIKAASAKTSRQNAPFDSESFHFNKTLMMSFFQRISLIDASLWSQRHCQLPHVRAKNILFSKNYWKNSVYQAAYRPVHE